MMRMREFGKGDVVSGESKPKANIEVSIDTVYTS
jgi:hypothetical protein